MIPYYQDNFVTIYHADSTILSLEADIIITDPPYGTGGWRRPSTGLGSNPSASLVKEVWDEGAVNWVTGDIPVISFWPSSRSSYLLNRANEVGLDKHRLVYWQKPDPKPQFGGRISWSVEPIWVLTKEGVLLYGKTDFYRESAIRKNRNAEAVDHPYQKPESVMRWLISMVKEELILDPFMGSGTTLVAAKSVGRKAVGIEIDEAYCEIAANRCRQDILGL